MKYLNAREQIRKLFSQVFCVAAIFSEICKIDGNIIFRNFNDIIALKSAGGKSLSLLALSALTTTLSWVCYYRAMKDGTVSFVSLADKASILVTLVLSVMLLGEPFTWRLAGGAALIVAGLVVLAGGK